nr:MAG TPA: hypothetical protein [Ackermannviridae sp.]
MNIMKDSLNMMFAQISQFIQTLKHDYYHCYLVLTISL